MNNSIVKGKKFGSRVKEFFDAPMRKFSALWLTAQTTALAIAPVYCAKINTNISMENLFGSMADVVILIARYVGLFMAIIGVLSLLMAMHQENPDGQNRAIKVIVIGAALVGFEQVLRLTGIIS